MRFGKVLLRDWLAREFPEAGAYARKKGFKPPVGIWMEKRAAQLGELVAAQPGVAEAMPPERVRAAFARAGADSQPAWSLLYYALWHSHHILGVDSGGDIGSVLDAARATASP
jgi:asparagine synthase (glutamine-hydrolysing)